MATGSLDANGVWIYGEDDSETTFSALLNKLGDSVSDALVSSGKVIQVKHGTTNTIVTTSSTSPVVTGVNVDITPKYATSKILLIASSTFYSNGSRIDLSLFRNSTVLSYNHILVGSGVLYIQTPIVSFLDTPSTTSSTNYSLRFNVNAGSGEAQWSTSRGTITAIEIGA